MLSLDIFIIFKIKSWIIIVRNLEHKLIMSGLEIHYLVLINMIK